MADKPSFVPGMALAEGFYRDEVRPVLQAHFSGMKYSAALIGSGSEVLRFDTEMSTDHHWGPRVMLFLRSNDYKKERDKIREVLSRELPTAYRGYSTNFSEPNPDDNGTQTLQPVVSNPVNHRVETFTIGGFFADYLGIDIRTGLEPIDWLTIPQQKLRSITAGGIFHDELGLEDNVKRFSWYPHDVWLYILAATWTRIGQEEHLMGRAGFVGDDISASIIASRLVRDIMRLAFFMERDYPPYAKWFGTAFSGLKSAGKLQPALVGMLKAGSWEEREGLFCSAGTTLVEMHNSLRITTPVPAEASPFWSRPFRVIQGEKIAAVIIDNISDPQIKRLTRPSLIGSIDIFSDNTDLLSDASFRTKIRRLYE
jgi:hypothetical protein